MDRPALPTNLSSLLTFVEAARAESFTRAARVVHVTQGAVSRQMRALEQELGAPLFRRTGRSVVLTPAGRAYLVEVERALAILERATGALKRGGRLVATLLPSFATFWLLPRLPLFEARHPDVRIELKPDYELVDLRGGGAHVALRYGRGGYPGVVSKRLFAETLVPVASPAVARRVHQGAFWEFPILSAGAEGEGEGDMDWRAWSEATGRSIPRSVRYRRLRDYQRVVHVARAGQGVAMGRLGLVEPLVASGALVPVSSERATGPTGHHFVCLAETWDDPAVQAFYRWLRAQARATSMRADHAQPGRKIVGRRSRTTPD
jgi:LysR family glycine cleavage system transcriptional activator